MSPAPPSTRSARHPQATSAYEIRVEGHLSPQWSSCFEGLVITLDPNGETALTGPVVDQASLFSIITRVRDLGLPLVGVRRLASEPATNKEVLR